MNERDTQQILHKRQQAARLRNQGRLGKSVELLQRANRKWRRNPELLTDLASTYISLPDFAKAEECLGQLLKGFSGNVGILRFVAESRYSMRRVDGALDAYEKWSQVDTTTPAAFLRAAAIQERQGCLREAEESLEMALERDPTSEEGRFMRTVLLVRGGRLEAAEQALCDLLAGGLHDRDIHWKAGHQLAAVLDKKGEYADAIQVLLASKQGMEKDYAKEIKAAREAFQFKANAIRQLTAGLTRNVLDRWRADVEEDFPVAVLAGHPRSGTTLLESIVDRHAGVVSVEETTCMEDEVFRSVFRTAAAKPELFELEFLNAVPVTRRTQAKHQYLRAVRQFPLPPPGQELILDKNPMLTHFLSVALRFFPGMKCLVALRDPRDVCLSCFQQPVGVNTSNVSWLSIEDTMSAYDDILGVWLRLRELLPDGWLEVRYEQLVMDTERVARQAVDFLGLPWQPEALRAPSTGRTVFSPSYAQVAKPVYRSAMRRWESYEEFLGPHLAKLNPTIQALGY